VFGVAGLLGLVAALCAPASVPVLVGTAAAAPPLAQIRESVGYLSARYGVSTAEAVRRTVLSQVGRCAVATILPTRWAVASCRRASFWKAARAVSLSVLSRSRAVR
jgi:hypothetical protein